MLDSDPDSPPPPPAASDRDLQPFFVLHRASSPAEATAEPEATTRKKTRRKIDVSQSPAKSRGKAEAAVFPEEPDNPHYEELRHRAFHQTWSKIEEEIKTVLRRIDRNLFDQVHAWILERFAGITSMRADCLHAISQPYPVIDDDEICIRIPAGLILTRNAESVDDLLTFRELGAYLKSEGCHVAYFSSLDFEAKRGTGDCLRSLLRQVVAVAPTDVADISVLALWYRGVENVGKPVVIIIDDTEQCEGSALAEFIMVLSEWAIKIPIILIFGVATSINALKKLLPSKALQHLQPFTFASESSHERMNSIIEAVLVRRCFGFCISYKVALFLKNYFLNHEGTLTSFVKALKIACAKHFYVEPLSFLGRGMLDDSSKIHDKVNDMRVMLLQGGQEIASKQEHKNVLRSISCGSSAVNTSTMKPCNRAAALMENIVRDHLKSIEWCPFHEVNCFKHVDILQEALIGDPRRIIQVDLRQSQTRIRCGCCQRDGKAMVSSMHDTSIIYSLAQDYGDLINLHDWYQSFKERILSSNKKAKRGMQSPASKKGNAAVKYSDTTEVMIQYP